MSDKKILNNVLLIDGSYMLIRALSQPSFSNMYNRKGDFSGGIYGFLTMFQSTVKRFPAYFPVVCWDYGQSPRRLNLMPNYKHHAEKAAGTYIYPQHSKDPKFREHLNESRAEVIKFLEYMRVPSVRIPDWEGDDLVYLITKKCNKCVVVTDDKDYIQLCSPTISVYRAMAQEYLTFDNIEKDYNYPQYEYYKAIKGDPSDNIPQSCNGIGERSALIIAREMAKFVEETQCSPHDYDIIFNYLALEPSLTESWKTVRGLDSKVVEFLKSKDKFILNMQLMDFSYIEEPAGMDSLLESQIIPTINKKADIIKMYELIGKYEISSGIEPSHLIMRAAGANTVLIKDNKNI